MKARSSLAAPSSIAGRRYAGSARRSVWLAAMLVTLCVGTPGLGSAAPGPMSGNVAPALTTVTPADYSMPALPIRCIRCDTQTLLPNWHFESTAARSFAPDFEADTSLPAPDTLVLRGTAAAKGYGVIKQTVAADAWRGKRVQLTALLQPRHVEAGAGLWLRVDGASQALRFDGQQAQAVRGTEGWKRYSVSMDVPADAQTLTAGVLLVGAGRLAVNDVHLDRVD